MPAISRTSLAARLISSIASGSSNYEPMDFSDDQNDENEVQAIIVEIAAAPVIEEEGDFDKEDNWRNINTYQSTLTRLIDLETLSGGSP